MLMTEKSHVTMNLIADDQHLMAVADIGELYECIFAPHDTRWIVGIAENQHTAFGVLFQDVFQSLEIHVIVAVGTQDEGIEDHFAAIAFGSKAEGMIDRSLYDDLLVGFQKYIHSHSDAFHDAWNIRYPFAFHLPLVMIFYPLDDGRPVIGWFHCIAEE